LVFFDTVIDDNPISYVDPLGDTATLADCFVIHRYSSAPKSTVNVQIAKTSSDASPVNAPPAPNNRFNKPGTGAKPSDKPKREAPDANEGLSKKSYFEKALKYANVRYVWGGVSPNGFDCTGLLCIVTGVYDPRFYARDKTNPPPPGGWDRVHPSTSSYDDFLKDVKKGDLFIWRGDHAAFYAGDGRIFGAHRDGVNSGFSESRPGWNELKQYWILGYSKNGKWNPGHGYPEVWRQK